MTSTDTSAAPSTREYRSIDDLAVSLADGVLSVTLNRPDSLNSLTQPMLVAIADAMDLAAGDMLGVLRLAYRNMGPDGTIEAGWARALEGVRAALRRFQRSPPACPCSGGNGAVRRSNRARRPARYARLPCRSLPASLATSVAPVP